MFLVGIGFPLLGLVAVAAAILSFYIQSCDAAEFQPAFNVAGRPKTSTTRLFQRNPTSVGLKSVKNLGNSNSKPNAANHYACPPTSVEALRKRYGTRKSIWGEWSCGDTRRFYKQQLPRALQIDGALGLTLEERALLAAEARHALRIYSRERCHLPGRLLARILDGIRHLQTFGYWSSTGMTLDEIYAKYYLQAKSQLGIEASEELIRLCVYRKVLERACETNGIVDEMVLEYKHQQLQETKDFQILNNIICNDDDENGNQIKKRPSSAPSSSRKRIHNTSSSSSTSNYSKSVEAGILHLNAAGTMVYAVLTSSSMSIHNNIHLMLVNR